MKTSTLMATVALLAAAIAACDTPPEDQDGNTMDSTHCEETITVLGSLSEVSSLTGLSAQELLTATGDQIEVGAWYTDDDEFVSQTPLGGETALTIAVTYSAGEIREIDSTLVEGETDIYLECDPRLEVDIEITVNTDDGAFDETWDAVVSASGIPSAALVPMIDASFDPDSLSGTFEWELQGDGTPDSVDGVMSAELQPEPNGPAGEIGINIEESSGDGPDGTVSQTHHVALMWGDWYW